MRVFGMGLNSWDFEQGPRFVASICSERQLHACMRMRVGSQVLTDPKVQRAMATLLGNTSVNAYGHRCAWPVPFRTASIPRSPRRLAIVRAEQSKQKVVAVLYKAGKAAENKDLLGCVENELGLREFLEEQVGVACLANHCNIFMEDFCSWNAQRVRALVQGHEYIVTDDKEGEDSELDKHLADANILISTPFHPAYLTKERIAKAKNLKLSITAGVGSDHVDLHAAADSGMTVAEVTGASVNE